MRPWMDRKPQSKRNTGKSTCCNVLAEKSMAMQTGAQDSCATQVPHVEANTDSLILDKPPLRCFRGKGARLDSISLDQPPSQPFRRNETHPDSVSQDQPPSLPSREEANTELASKDKPPSRPPAARARKVFWTAQLRLSRSFRFLQMPAVKIPALSVHGRRRRALQAKRNNKREVVT